MKLDRVINELNLTVLTKPKDFENIDVHGGYVSDLLSCVMAGAPHGGVWVTLQAHNNIVAVAALLDLSAVIISESAAPDPAAIAKANEEGITLLGSSLTSYQIVGRLWEMGLRTE